jgi:hypothetical protein
VIPVWPFKRKKPQQAVPTLVDQVYELVKNGRRRTAMDEILRRLRHDPKNDQLLNLAIATLDSSRTDVINSPEPATGLQRASALLAPIVTECYGCHDEWYSKHNFLHPHMKLTIMNPRALQCQVCRYTLCRDCLRPAQRSPVELLERPCPARGCHGMLTAPVLATGRRNFSPIDPDTIERIIVARDGPIPPSRDDALSVAIRFVPIIADDAPLLRIRPSFPGMMNDERSRGRLAVALVQGLESEGVLAPGSWERSRSMHVLGHAVGDADYLMIVVRKPESAAKPAWHHDVAGLMHDHTRRMLHRMSTEGPGECWSGLGSPTMVTVTMQLLDQAYHAARRSGGVGTSTGATGNYAIAATVVFTSDFAEARDQFAGGYLAYCVDLIGRLRQPVDKQPPRAFVNWILTVANTGIKIETTVIPAAGSEPTMFAWDLMTSAERQQAGL